MDRVAATAALIRYGQLLHRQGLIHARVGNLSVRLDDGTLLITRSRVHKGFLTPKDMVLLDAAGEPQEATPVSSELGLHLAAYAALPAIGAVGHAHPIAATELAHRGIALDPTLTEEGLAVLGPSALLANTPVDARNAAWGQAVAAGTRAALLADHGLVVAGADLHDVFCKLELAEWLAELQTRMRRP